MVERTLELVCLLTIITRVALREINELECSHGSLTITSQADDVGFISIDCSNAIFGIPSINAESDESCEAIQNLKIVQKGEWQVSEGRSKVMDLLTPADYVVINMLPHPYPVGGDHRRKLQNLQSEHNINHGNMLYNFIITNDGTIYEGLGWDKENILFSGGLKSVRIRFMTEDSSVSPGPAIKAFKNLVRSGKCRGSIAPNYKLIPHSYVRDYVPSSTYKKEFELLNQLDNLEDDKSFDSICSISPPTSMTYREEWGIRLEVSKLKQYDSAIDIVVVRDFNVRCFTVNNCHSTLKYFRDRGRLEDINFFLGEDGQIYENLGWDFAASDWFKTRRAIVVAFLGTYSNYPPSKRLLSNFNKFLRYGVSNGYLSKGYLVSSYRSIKDDASFVGSALHNELIKFATFTERIS